MELARVIGVKTKNSVLTTKSAKNASLVNIQLLRVLRVLRG